MGTSPSSGASLRQKTYGVVLEQLLQHDEIVSVFDIDVLGVDVAGRRAAGHLCVVMKELIGGEVVVMPKPRLRRPLVFVRVTQRHLLMDTTKLWRRRVLDGP